MAIKYVNAAMETDGDGSGPENAFKSISRLIANNLSAGDIVYIAPGTYRENITLAHDGTSANPIKWIGDVNAEVFTAQNPGIIRITSADTNEVLSTGTTPTVTMSGVDYQQFYNITFDGHGKSTTNTSGEHVAVYYTTSTGTLFRNCHFQGGYAGVYRAYDGTFVDCLFSNSLIGIYGQSGNDTPNVIGCVAMCSSVGFIIVSAYNSLSICGKRGFQNSETVNCASAGGEYGYWSTSNNTTNENCVSWANYFPFAGSADNKMHLRGAVAANPGYRTFVNLSGSAHYLVEGGDATEFSVDAAFESHPITSVVMDYTKLMSLREIFIPKIGKGMIVSASVPIQADPAGSTHRRTTADGANLNGDIIGSMDHPFHDFFSYDVRGTERVFSTSGFPSPAGILATIPLEVQIDATSSAAPTGMVSQSAPAIVMRGRGENLFEVPIPSGSYFTASVNVKHTGSTDDSYARMVVSSSRINQSSGSIFDRFATASAQSTNNFTFSNIQVRVDSVAYDTTYILKLQAPATGAFATASFSDLTIS